MKIEEIKVGDKVTVVGGGMSGDPTCTDGYYFWPNQPKIYDVVWISHESDEAITIRDSDANFTAVVHVSQCTLVEPASPKVGDTEYLYFPIFGDNRVGYLHTEDEYQKPPVDYTEIKMAEGSRRSR